MIKKLPIESIVDKVSDFNDFKILYASHSYDKIFIDFTDDIGKKISSFIKEVNPLQNIIQLNSEFPCRNIGDCDNCQIDFNVKSVIKPFNQFQITKIITNRFECENFKKTKHDFLLEKVKKLVYEDLPYIVYDEKNSCFIFDDLSDSLQTSAIIKITEYLDDNKLSYEIKENNSIYVLK